MKRVVVCLLLSAILLAACSNEKTEESLAPSEDAAVSTAFSEEAGAVSGTSSDAEESSMNENTKQPAVPFYQVCRLSAVIIPSQSPMELS